MFLTWLILFSISQSVDTDNIPSCDTFIIVCLDIITVGILMCEHERNSYLGRGCRDRERIVVGFTTTCAISGYHH